MRTIGAIAVALNGKTADFERKFLVAEKTLTRFGNRTKILGTQMATMGRTMTMTLTLPLAALAAAGVKAFAGFDKAMIESLAIMGNVTDKMKKDMRDMAKMMSTKSTFAARSLAKGYFYLASAGMDAAQSLKALAPATKFAQAGAFDLALAVDLLTDAQSALGLTSKDAEKNMKNMTKVSDVLVKANTIANATVQQFSESLTRQAGPAMKEMKMDIEEGVSVLAAFADQGIKAELAGGYLARTLRLLGQGAVKHKAAYKRLGIEVFDGQGKMKKMADIIESLTKALGPMSDELRIATFGEIGFAARTRMAIAPLMGLSDKIREYERQLRSAGGITEEVASKQLQAFGNQMKMVWNRIVIASMEMGNVLIPTLKKLATKVEEIVAWFSKLTDAERLNILKWAGLLAAIGPVLFIAGKLLTVIGLLTTAFKFMALKALVPLVVQLAALQSSLLATTLSVNVLTVAVTALHVVAIGGLIAAAAALGVGLGLLIRKIPGVGSGMDSLATKTLRLMGLYTNENQAIKRKAEYWKKEREAMNATIATREKLIAIAAVTNATTAPRVVDEKTLKARERLEKTIMKLAKNRAQAIFEELKGEQKVSVLMGKRARLEEELSTARALGRKVVEYGIQEKILNLIDQIRSLQGIKGDEGNDKFSTAGAGGRYAAAVEKGTVEAYRTELGQQKILNKVEKNTKESADSTEKSVTLLEESRDFLMRNLEIEVVAI